MAAPRPCRGATLAGWTEPRSTGPCRTASRSGSLNVATRSLLVAVLPLLPYMHPRMASEYDGPTELRQLEPPGFMGFNYGLRTPLTTLLGQAVYGATLGGLAQLQGGGLG